jgi:hypothetical protein
MPKESSRCTREYIQSANFQFVVTIHFRFRSVIVEFEGHQKLADEARKAANGRTVVPDPETVKRAVFGPRFGIILFLYVRTKEKRVRAR